MPKRFLRDELPPLPNPEELLPPIGLPPKPMKNKVPKKSPEMPEPDKSAPKPKLPSPPLFVKLDKYKEIMGMFNNLKSEALGLRDTLEVLADVEAEMKRSLDVANRTLEKFNQALNTLTVRMSKVSADEPETEHAKPSLEIDDYVGDIQKHIERIKKELNNIPIK